MWVIAESRSGCCCQRQLQGGCSPAGDWEQDYGQRNTILYLNPWEEAGVKAREIRTFKSSCVYWGCGVKAHTQAQGRCTRRKYLREPWAFIPGWLVKAFPCTETVCKAWERWMSFQMTSSNKRWQDIQRNSEIGPIQRNTVNLQKLTLKKHRPLTDRL